MILGEGDYGEHSYEIKKKVTGGWSYFIRNYFKFGPLVKEMLFKEKFMHHRRTKEEDLSQLLALSLWLW